jgi:hypothetical protein
VVQWLRRQPNTLKVASSILASCKFSRRVAESMQVIHSMCNFRSAPTRMLILRLAFLAWATIHHADVALVASAAAFPLECNCDSPSVPHYIGRLNGRALVV